MAAPPKGVQSGPLPPVPRHIHTGHRPPPVTLSTCQAGALRSSLQPGWVLSRVPWEKPPRDSWPSGPTAFSRDGACSPDMEPKVSFPGAAVDLARPPPAPHPPGRGGPGGFLPTPVHPPRSHVCCGPHPVPASSSPPHSLGRGGPLSHRRQALSGEVFAQGPTGAGPAQCKPVGRDSGRATHPLSGSPGPPRPCPVPA